MSDDYLCIAPSADEVAALMDAAPRGLNSKGMEILRRLAYRLEALEAELDESIKACDEAEADLARMTETCDELGDKLVDRIEDCGRLKANLFDAEKRIAELESMVRVATG